MTLPKTVSKMGSIWEGHRASIIAKRFIAILRNLEWANFDDTSSSMEFHGICMTQFRWDEQFHWIPISMTQTVPWNYMEPLLWSKIELFYHYIYCRYQELCFMVILCDHLYELCYIIRPSCKTASGWWVILVKYVLMKKKKMRNCLLSTGDKISWQEQSETAQYARSPWLVDVLTHWGRHKMAAILQTTFWNAFSWMNIVVLLYFDGNCFGVELAIIHHWFR